MFAVRYTRPTMVICLAGLALAIVTIATPATAQDRAETWEFALGTFYQFGTDLDFTGGSTVETGGDFGLSLNAGYNFTDKLATVFGLQWAGVDYNANVIEEDGDITGIRGSYDTWAISGNLVYNFSDGPITPYVGAGIGWTWLDTNIPDGLPWTGCWWDPWYGWVCYTTYPTKTTDALSYQASLGLRWEFGMSSFVRLNYTSQWQDFDNADGTPRFDVIGAEIGWMF